MNRRRPPLHALAAAALLLAGPLCACAGTGQAPPAPSASGTVHVDPEAAPVDPATVEPGEEYAPVLAWTDRDTLSVTTLGSSTRDCWPRVQSSALEQDQALRLVLGHGRPQPGAGCTDDLAEQGLAVGVPAGWDADGVVRLVWDEEPGIVYEYPMGESRPG